MLCALLVVVEAAHLQAVAGVVADLQNLDVLLIGRLEHPAGDGQADDGGREGRTVFR
jgi:hypothetical protein